MGTLRFFLNSVGFLIFIVGSTAYIPGPVFKLGKHSRADHARSYVSMQLSLDQKSRREMLAVGASFMLGLSVKPDASQAVDSGLVAVVGAGGYTGGDCVRSLAARGISVRAVSRSSIPLSGFPQNLVSAAEADVTVPASLPAALRGASSVIFSASARKRSSQTTGSDSAAAQTYEDVEHLGLINVAKTCIENKVKRLVVVSSSCTACRDPGGSENGERVDKATGLSCEQCRSKRAGEDAVRELYAQANNPSLGYTIVRVGFLTTGEKRGISQIELNQGESKTGIISRQDLADLLIEAAASPEARGTTFECYYRDTAQPVDIAQSLAECRKLGKSTQVTPSTIAAISPLIPSRPRLPSLPLALPPLIAASPAGVSGVLLRRVLQRPRPDLARRGPRRARHGEAQPARSCAAPWRPTDRPRRAAGDSVCDREGAQRRELARALSRPGAGADSMLLESLASREQA
jgi:nucleoside-diphosphate-sugar epimerase